MKSCFQHSYCKVCRPDLSTKLSDIAKQRYENFDERVKTSAALRASVQSVSKETRRKMSIAGKKRAQYENSVARLQTSEARQKMALTKRGKPASFIQLENLKKGRGMPFTEERKQKIKQALQRHATICIKACHNSQNPSKVAWKMIDWLQFAGFEVLIPEARFGPYSVDCLLAEEWIGFEADGTYWHSLEGKAETEKQRDQFLLSEFDLPIVRLSESEINCLRTPNRQPEPGIPQVGETESLQI